MGSVVRSGLKCVLVKPCGIVYTGLSPIEVVLVVVVVGHSEVVVGGRFRLLEGNVTVING